MIEAQMPPPDTEEADPLSRLLSFIGAANIAFDLPGEELARIGRKVVDDCETDLESRKDAGWDERNRDAIKMAMQVREEKTFPWPNAANIKYPLITTAAIQFAARAYPAIVDGWNVAKGKVLGQPTEEKRARADRLGQHLSYQLLEEMEEWEPETDQLLHILPITGTVFRKTWFDPGLRRNRSEIVFPDRLIAHYWAKGDDCRRTQVIDYSEKDVIERVRSGLWIDPGKLAFPEQPEGNDAESEHAPGTELFLEQHTVLDLDQDGYPEPYVVTVHRDTGKVVRIVARFDERGVTVNGRDEVVSIRPIEYFTKYVFIPSLDGGWYGVGFGSLLGSLGETINATINQLLDAGTLANTGGGFLGSGVTLRGGNLSFKPGEWKRVAADGGALKDNIVPLPVIGPSSVLFSLLGMMIEAARDITATKDILTGETQGSNQAVGTTLAMIEQGLKVFTAIYKRIHRALRNELRQMCRLNRLYLDPQVYFTFHDVEGAVALEDYDDETIDVIPVSDPTIVTDMQRMGRAQFLVQTFRGDPNVDQRVLDRRVMEAAGIPDINELMPEPKQPPMPPADVIKAMAQAEIDSRKVAIQERQADADIASTLADAEAKTLQTMLSTNPAIFALVRDIVRQEMSDGQAPVRGMGGSAIDAGGADLPSEPGAGLGPPMGGGVVPFPGGPDQGAPAVGTVPPQV